MSAAKKPALGFIFVTILLDVIGFGIIIPILPKYISHLTGGDLSNASLYSGWLMFSFAIMQFICSPILGNLSDRFGRRPILLASLFGFGVDYLIIAFAPTIGWLFVGRILAGVMGASFTTAAAYIADISTPEKRAQNFGLIGAAFGLGFIIGPALGGVLGHYGFRIPFYVAAALTFLNWIYGYFVLPESLSKRNRRRFDIKRANPIGSLKQLRKYPIISGLVASLICIYLSNYATQSTWTFFTMEKFGWSEMIVGLSLAMVGLSVAIVQGGLIRVINPKLGPVKSVYFGLTFSVLGLLLTAFVPQGWMLFALMLPFSLGGVAGPAIQGIISNQVPANEQGELQGALTSLMSLTSIIGPLLMTGLFSFFTSKSAPVYFPGAPFVMAALLVLLGGMLAKGTLSTIKHKEKPAASAEE